MNVRRRRPLTEPAASAAMALCRAERAVALLDCVRPLGLDAELSRLSAAFQRGQRLTPVFRYAERVSLGPLRRELEALARNVDSGDVELGLIAERASELAVEAELAENVGSPRLGTLAPRRFPLPPDAERVEGCARQLLSASTPVFEPGTRCHVSDDSADPRSL